MNKWVRILAPAAMAAFLSACGGGGGGGGGGTSATVGSLGRPTAVPTGTTQSLQGSSHEARYTWDTSTGQVTAVGAVTTFGPTASAQYTTDSNGNFTDIFFTSANGTILNFSQTAGDIFSTNARVGGAVSRDGDRIALFVRPEAFGWNYQTFGVWETGVVTGNGTAGAFSLGTRTPGTSIPTTGTATYNGATTGFYVDSFNNAYLTVSDLSVGADFGNRTLAFSTTNSLASADSRTFSPNNSLNMSGTLTYAAGVNQFSGPVTTNSGMRGTARGQFYGPNAEEIGGGFEARAGSGNMSYIGSFGGKR